MHATTLLITAVTVIAMGCGETASPKSPANNGDANNGSANNGGANNGSANNGSANNGVSGNEMLDAHNAVRRNVSPAADPPIPDLVWDDDLAASAQAWADGCKFQHSGPGENLYASSGSSSPQDVVDSWASEVANYTYSNNSCSGVCGHYTQIVWRDTARVGCAATQCDNLDAFGGPGEMWVCQYDPPGNFVGRKPY